MSPADATVLAERLADAQFWITVLCAFIGSLTWAIWWLCGRLADGCPHCPHCTDVREEQERRDKEITAKYSASPKTTLWKPPSRPNTPEETRERLFGRQVVSEEDVPPEEGSSGDEDGGSRHGGTKDG